MKTTHHSERKTYLGQECRIVRAYICLDGLQSYKLRTACRTIAVILRPQLRHSRRRRILPPQAGRV